MARPSTGSATAAGNAVPGPAVPFTQFILKLHSRCNLACSYCYIYEAADTSWRHRPLVPAPRVREQTARRIAEHATAHQPTHISVVLHGGEPMLAGAEVLAETIDGIRAAVPAGCTVHPAIQTNATLLADDRLRLLASRGIRVGVSLDGGLPHHNRERRDHAGRPSWAATAAGLRLLADHYPGHYAGILAVIDLRTDPAELYESLLSFRPPIIDLLLPLGNWSAPPPGLPAPESDPVPYGTWLRTVFDLWWHADRRGTRIRIFEECIALLLGFPAATESLGLQPFTAVVVETDGSIEQVDSLKSAYEGAAATGLDVFRHSFDDALAHPGIAARQAGLAALADDCLQCPLVRVCGGGDYAHRYRAGVGFRQPSIYCADLQYLIRHIAGRLREVTSS
ncbi:FxsB family cyclophane-forming radical SAM/SPASM peptide maturase [Streptomyces marianii]|uniref:FxsB family radical SAM/SPASM domain protein n=1 Tax=Streptomyces marianii TaxID=1817406 RepID=A0A5R9EDR3_9ACTN|nr:FxsB family cyclophane-forming radical SAM/SPASM peptide maturase [Streptomyces marianii]TLQ47297.1 FxsB family radical SAM/SPASM domain protein [Streptomyces marianii]